MGTQDNRPSGVFDGRIFAVWVAMCIWSAVESFSLLFRYTKPFVSLTDVLHLALVSIGTASIVALLIGLVWTAANSALKQTPESPRMLYLVPLAVALAAFALVNTGDGNLVRFGGLKYNALTLGIVVVLVGVAAFLGRAKPDAIHAGNRTISTAFIVGIWFFAGYFSDFVCGKLGFAGHPLRPGIMLAFIIASLCLPFAVVIYREAVERKLRWVVTVLGLFLALGLYVVNTRMYVDDYLDIHWWLFFAASWLTVAAVRTLVSFRPPREGVVFAVIAAIGASVVLTAGPTTHVGYLSRIHTTHQRFQNEIVRSAISPLRSMRTFVEKEQRRTMLACGGALPIDDVPLPDSFVQPISHGTRLGLAPAKNAVLFLLDMKRPKDIGLYGEGKSQTPLTDACLNGGFVFDRAYSAAASTSVAFPSVYTGSYEPARQFFEFRNVRPAWFVEPTGRNLPNAMKTSGLAPVVLANKWYEVEFFNDKTEAKVFSGFEKFFYEGNAKGKSTTAKLQTAYDAVGGVVPSEPFFLVVHIVSHSMKEIDEVDQLIGKICDEIGKRKSETAFLLTADHGIQYREHGRTTYGHTTFDEEIRVPFIFKYPGVVGRRVADPVSTVDILPTLVDAVGGEVGFPVEGKSFLPVVKGERLPKRFLFSETQHPDFPSSAVIGPRFKFMRWHTHGQEAFFDLENDPGELRNVIESEKDAAEKHRRLLDGFLQSVSRE